MTIEEVDSHLFRYKISPNVDESFKMCLHIFTFVFLSFLPSLFCVWCPSPSFITSSRRVHLWTHGSFSTTFTPSLRQSKVQKLKAAALGKSFKIPAGPRNANERQSLVKNKRENAVEKRPTWQPIGLQLNALLTSASPCVRVRSDSPPLSRDFLSGGFCDVCSSSCSRGAWKPHQLPSR